MSPLLCHTFLAVSMCLLLTAHGKPQSAVSNSQLSARVLQARNLTEFLHDIPVACQVQCDIVVGAALNCDTLSCVCTEDNSHRLEGCVDCIVALNPAQPGIIPKNQAILDEWRNDYCRIYPIPSLYLNVPSTLSASSSSASPTASTTVSSSARPRAHLPSLGTLLPLMIAWIGAALLAVR